MPRPPRKEYAGALYHVTCRGNGRGQIFFDGQDAERFRSQLADGLKTYDVVLYAYAIMPNHYHLLVRTRQANLGRFMQRLNTSYALYSRYKHRKPGHRLEGRYKAKLVQGDDYLVTLTRYIHLNPVKVRAARKLGSSDRRALLEREGWSSYRGYVEEGRQEETVCYDVLKQFGEGDREARRRYRGYVLACMDEDDEALKRSLMRSGHGIGDEAYVAALERELRERQRGEDQDRDVAYPREQVGLERIERVVANACGVAVEALREPGRRAGAVRAKTLAMEVACRLSGLTQREIGKRYGGISTQAVSMARKRARVVFKAGEVDRLVDKIRAAG
jgi:REP element-mobilizing transposase RayT